MAYMMTTYGMPESLCHQLLKGRGYDGYKQISDSRGSDVIVSMTKTPHSALEGRDRILNLVHGSKVVTNITSPSHVVRSQYPMAFRSLYMCVISGSDIDARWVQPVAAKQCSGTSTPFIYPNCTGVGYMSPTFGMESPCNILMRSGDVWTELHDDQSVNPILYMDNCGYLDPIVEGQMQRLLRPYGYVTPLSMSLDGPTLPCVTSDQPVIIRQSRQCISIGCVNTKDELVRLWMVRPTINYSTYIVTTTESKRDITMSMYMSRFRLVGNYSGTELNIRQSKDSPCEILVSGTMAHYYIHKTGIEARIHHVSLGGSTLRVHQVRDFNTSPKVVDICMNMGILRSITAGARTGLLVEASSKSVKLKYHTNAALGQGPSLILGCNGGFQWTGNPTSMSESLHVMFALMSFNIKQVPFANSIAHSRVMTKYVYPSGVPRTKDTIVF
jgi:hypothetical protein